MKLRHHLKRKIKTAICWLVGHKSEQIYVSYVRSGRRFLKYAPLYKCKRCGLVYAGFDLILFELRELLEATLKDLPRIDLGKMLPDYDVMRLWEKNETPLYEKKL